MMIRINLFLLFLTYWIFSGAQNSLPNIILVVADDLGYGDLSCYGASDINTPNLDRLAKEGVKFSNFYANGPECSPTRAALLTGRYQQRIGGLECAIGSGNVGRYAEALKLSDVGQLGLPVRFNVLPSILNQRGYRSALIGKWHLGYNDGFRPVDHGFHYSIGPLSGGVDYFHHTEPEGFFISKVIEGKHDLFRNDKEHFREGYYLTDLISDESNAWLNIQSRETPFFLYVPYTAPHNPLQSSNDYLQKNRNAEDWNKGSRQEYIQVVQDLDRGIGKMLDFLDENGLSENTIFIFFSDNGPTKYGSAGNLRGTKGGVFEGGIRVPCIIRWPGKIIPGQISKQVSIGMDLTASINAVVGGKVKFELDGIDIIDHVVSGKKDFDRTLFWRLKRAENLRKAVRNGSLKYVYNFENGQASEYLFDLSSDPGESRDLKMQNTKDLDRLRALLAGWEEEVKPERYSQE
ncbi:MAG: sulfatase-like hydrolase/transferase [Saprospiraceae bacterium]|nr:sulfatase-like hydrolase/transferase [Saprospiraceae bacterium]